MKSLVQVHYYIHSHNAFKIDSVIQEWNNSLFHLLIPLHLFDVHVHLPWFHRYPDAHEGLSQLYHHRTDMEKRAK